ncbi:MAG: DegV family protein [Candidatus Saccharibacteria bacterium]|nr:DegV family protein [Candidatus Saccharibacteria bacterium]
MKNFKIVVDATADLDPRWLALHSDKIVVIPVAISDDGETRYDCVGLMPGMYHSSVMEEIVTNGFSTVDEFYDRLIAQRTRGKIVRSTFAQAAPYAIFEELFEAGQDFIYLGMTSALSGTYEHNSRMVAEFMEDYPDVRVACIDSKCIAPGYRLLIERLIAKDLDFDQTLEFVKREGDSIVHLFTIDDFGQAVAGGRVSSTEAIFGTLAHIKPYMRFDYRMSRVGSGEDSKKKLFTSSKVRGTRKLNQQFIEEIKRRIATEEQRAEDPTKNIIIVSHAQAPERVDNFCEQLRKELPAGVEIRGGRVGPAVGSHVGETTMAIFFTAREPSTVANPTWQMYGR